MIWTSRRPDMSKSLPSPETTLSKWMVPLARLRPLWALMPSTMLRHLALELVLCLAPLIHSRSTDFWTTGTRQLHIRSNNRMQKFLTMPLSTRLSLSRWRHMGLITQLRTRITARIRTITLFPQNHSTRPSMVITKPRWRAYRRIILRVTGMQTPTTFICITMSHGTKNHTAQGSWIALPSRSINLPGDLSQDQMRGQFLTEEMTRGMLSRSCLARHRDL